MRQLRWSCGLSWLVLGFCSVADLAAAELAVEAASVEQAIKVLDLRTLELPAGPIPSEMRQVGSVNYESKENPKAAFEAQQKQFLNLGWKELPGTMAEAAYGSGMFQKSTFVVNVSTSDAGRPDRPGMSRVSIINFGNVPLKKLPIIKGAKALFANEATAIYTTDLQPAEAADATRKQFLDAGWEPYGMAGDAATGLMQTFKRNAIQVQANASVAPAQGGKTAIMYSSLLLSADIPAPANAADVHYVDMLKTLRFSTTDSHADIAKFYQQALAKRGWKPTTEELITGTDRFKRATGMQIFRNKAEEMMQLDLQTQKDKNLVVMKHLTATELADQEARARAAAEKLVAEREVNSKKPMPKPESDDFDAELKKALTGTPAGTPTAKGGKVAIPLPATAKKVDQTGENVLQIKLPAGQGKGGAEFIRDQLTAADWTLDNDVDLDDTSGNFTFKKGTQQITMAFVDTGVTDVTLMVIGIGAKLEGVKFDPKAKGPEAKPTTRPSKVPADPK
ncbi:MAG: hypothetical protein JSS49_13430 [Planctomycetes bacterium]|nr:hypothetical protein [Planctomycetota bacterium]